MPTVRETPLPGPIPRFEIPGWRERFGVVAGITGRGNEPGRGFDLGLWTDSPVGEVMHRWRAFRHAEPGFHATILGTQVHGTTVIRHGDAAGWIQLEGVDGHLTARPGVLLAVTIADCIPVYLVDPVSRTVGLLHAGWRGTAGGIMKQAITQLVEASGSAVENIVVHCGIGICGSCYEVGSEVMAGCGQPHAGQGPWHLDLREVLTQSAIQLGIKEISTSGWCSAHNREFFYSHRASGGKDGRMVAYLGVPEGRGANENKTRG